MTAFNKDGQAKFQLGSLQADGQRFGADQIKELLKGVKAESIVKSKKGKK